MSINKLYFLELKKKQKINEKLIEIAQKKTNDWCFAFQYLKSLLFLKGFLN